MKTIPRVHINDLSRSDFYRHYQKEGNPVVIAGAIADEPDWNLDYLCQQIGEIGFFVRSYGRERYHLEKRQWKTIGSGVEVRKMKFAQYAQMLRDYRAREEDFYLAKAAIAQTPLANSSALNSLGDRLGLEHPLTYYKMYMGHGNHTASLHYDILDGTLVQLHGAKKVTLFPPEQWRNLYPFPIFIHLRHGMKLRCVYSQIDLDNPDWNAFPRYREALVHKREVIIQQGEVLFIPMGWWHEIVTLGEMSCSLSRFWRIYPRERRLSWLRCRPIAGNLLAIPSTLRELAIAVGSRGDLLARTLYRL